MTSLLRMGFDFMTHTFVLGWKFPVQSQPSITVVESIKPLSLSDTFLSFCFYCCYSLGVL